jgi:hypothetical protein
MIIYQPISLAFHPPHPPHLPSPHYPLPLIPRGAPSSPIPSPQSSVEIQVKNRTSPETYSLDESPKLK